MNKLKVAICGYGGLGRVHAGNLIKMNDVEIVAVCDSNPKRLEPVEIKINIQQNGPVFDISKSKTYTDFKIMLRKENPDAVIACLPTNIHAKFAIMAMNEGIHVFSEKPMALNVKECNRMIAARDKNKIQLQIGQCLRFWPEYEALLKAVREKTYGKLKSLIMTRIGAYSTWAEPNWFNDGKCSGGAILDLHLHDVDWAYHALGFPKALCAAGTKGISGEIDDVTAVWKYDDFIVTMRGSWMYQGFSMSFQAFFENAAMDFGMHPDINLHVKTAGKREFEKIPVSQESGYFKELRYFLDCVRGKTENTICSGESTRESVGLVMLENKSITKQKWITL